MFANLTNSDIMILATLIGLILVVGIICIVLTIKSDKNSLPKKKNIPDDDKDNEKKVIHSEPDIHIALATQNIPAIEEDIKEDELEKIPEKEEIKIDKETQIMDKPLNDGVQDKYSIDEEKEKIQDDKNATSIEEVLNAMQVDIEKEKYDAIDRYEEEQEDNAVINYQELLNKKMSLNNDEKIEKLEADEETNTNFLEEAERTVEDNYAKPLYDDNNFSTSEFISPIFGRVNNHTEYPTVKKTVETEEFTTKTIVQSDKEVNIPEETEEFLNTLKEFRKNL